MTLPGGFLALRLIEAPAMRNLTACVCWSLLIGGGLALPAEATADGPKFTPILPSGHTDAVRSVALSKNGKFVVTASSDRSAIMWDIATAKPLRVFQTRAAAGFFAVTLSDDDRYLVT